MKTGFGIVMGLSLAVALGQVQAGGLVVLHDAGGTLPLAPFYEAVGLDERSLNPSNLETQKPSFDPSELQSLRSRVRSPGLTPGKVARRATGEAGTHLPRPLFLVGADDRSLAWLASYRDRLRKIGAVGLIVQSDGPDDLRRVQEVAGDLTLAVGSGATLARQLGIEHYPALIGPEWIEQ